jgi:hypothetical protein
MHIDRYNAALVAQDKNEAIRVLETIEWPLTQARDDVAVLMQGMGFAYGPGPTPSDWQTGI